MVDPIYVFILFTVTSLSIAVAYPNYNDMELEGAISEVRRFFLLVLLFFVVRREKWTERIFSGPILTVTTGQVLLSWT